MNCKKIKKLLLTDYSDGQLKPHIDLQIKKHLEKCRGCRDFEQIIRIKTIQPFKNSEELKPPAQVWQNIKTTIESLETKTTPSFATMAKEKLSLLFNMPRPAYALATACLIILLVINFIPKKQATTLDFYSQAEDELVKSIDADGDFLNFDTLLDNLAL